MSIFSFIKRKQVREVSKPAGDGAFTSAVVIDARDSAAGVRAEMEYITRLCGERKKDWNVQEQSLVEHNGRPYDEIVVVLSTGEKRTFLFDISSFFGK